MADVASDDVRYEKHGQKDANSGEYEIEQVGVFCFESRGEEMLDFFNQKLQREGCKTSA